MTVLLRGAHRGLIVADPVTKSGIHEISSRTGELQCKSCSPAGRPGYKLKPGELGYLATMRDLLADAQRRRVRALLVFDDDALLHQEFAQRLEHILGESDRCAGFLLDGGR